MTDPKDFAKNFNGLTIPNELLKLLDFDNSIAKQDLFSAGFEFSVTEEKFGLKTYSEDEQFLNSILEFANADGSGSTYGFWLRNNTENLNEAPIVVFGSEGGFHIVAENIRGLLQILAYDAEPMVSWEEVNYYKDESDEASTQNETYKKWLLDNFKSDLSLTADEIVKAAQLKYGEEFKAWMKKFYK